DGDIDDVTPLAGVVEEVRDRAVDLYRRGADERLRQVLAEVDLRPVEPRALHRGGDELVQPHVLQLRRRVWVELDERGDERRELLDLARHVGEQLLPLLLGQLLPAGEHLDVRAYAGERRPE